MTLAQTGRGNLLWVSVLIFVLLQLPGGHPVRPPAAQAARSSVALSFPHIYGLIGGEVQIPLNLEVSGAGIESIEVTIEYDPAVLQFQGVELGPNLAGWFLATNRPETGQLVISLASSQSLTQSGTIVDLGFQVLAGSPQVTPMGLRRGVVNEGNVSASLADGSVTIVESLPTATPTSTPTSTPTATQTGTPTATVTPSPTKSPTATPTTSPTATGSPTATATATQTGTPTATVTPSPTASPTATPTASPTATGSPTATATATQTGTPTATATPSPTASPTATPTASLTASPSPTASGTPSPTPAVATVLPEQGGSVRDQIADAAVRADFPPGAYGEPITVTLAPVGDPPGNGEQGRLGDAFSINAVDGENQPITRFDKPFTLTVTYTGSDWAELADVAWSFYYWSTAEARWVVIATRRVGEGTFEATIDHLTDFALWELDERRLYLPTIRGR